MHLSLPEPFYVIIQLIPFLIVVFALKAWVFDPTLELLAERRRRTHGFGRDATELQSKVDQQLREVEMRLVQARQKASESRAKILASASNEAREIATGARSATEKSLRSYREELLIARQAAAEALRTDAFTMSREIASRVAGRIVS